MRSCDIFHNTAEYMQLPLYSFVATRYIIEIPDNRRMLSGVYKFPYCRLLMLYQQMCVTNADFNRVAFTLALHVMADTYVLLHYSKIKS